MSLILFLYAGKYLTVYTATLDPRILRHKLANVCTFYMRDTAEAFHVIYKLKNE